MEYGLYIYRNGIGWAPFSQAELLATQHGLEMGRQIRRPRVTLKPNHLQTVRDF